MWSQVLQRVFGHVVASASNLPNLQEKTQSQRLSSNYVQAPGACCTRGEESHQVRV